MLDLKTYVECVMLGSVMLGNVIEEEESRKEIVGPPLRLSLARKK